MIQNKHILSALPLVADVLGRKYGMRVHIGGSNAYTDGRGIHLPSLPLDSDGTIRNLAWLIRHTFLKPERKRPKEKPDPSASILNWLRERQYIIYLVNFY